MAGASMYGGSRRRLGLVGEIIELKGIMRSGLRGDLGENPKNR